MHTASKLRLPPRHHEAILGDSHSIVVIPYPFTSPQKTSSQLCDAQSVRVVGSTSRTVSAA